MNINHQYLLNYARSVAATVPNARILDFGCGEGEVVMAGRKIGLEIYGAEVFYGGSSIKENVQKSGLLGKEIREIKNGRIDFDNEFFDLVMANQVFEHVEDMNATLQEIYRVMKQDAVFLSLFPSKEVMREGHIGIPFAHWFPKGSRIRYYYTLALRFLGFGYFKETKPKSHWTKVQLEWIDKYTYYRRKKEILESSSRLFHIKMIENDYIRFRLSVRSITKPFTALLNIPLATRIARALFYRLAGMVIFAKKRAIN